MYLTKRFPSAEIQILLYFLKTSRLVFVVFEVCEFVCVVLGPGDEGGKRAVLCFFRFPHISFFSDSAFCKVTSRGLYSGKLYCTVEENSQIIKSKGCTGDPGLLEISSGTYCILIKTLELLFYLSFI